MGVDVSKTFLLFVEAFAKGSGRVAMIKNVAARFEFHLELGNAEGPSSECLHEASLKIEKTEQPPGAFFDRKFSAQLPPIARKAVGIRSGTFDGGGALFRTGDRRN